MARRQARFRKEQFSPMSRDKPLSRVASQRVVVVGGGIAGMQACLELAAVGLPVTLVEEGPSLGGLMAQLDKTFPTNDCAICILSPRMLEVARHPLIDILTLTRVTALRGVAGDFQVVLSRRPRYVEVDRCSACGECLRVCPVRIPDPYNLGLSRTRAIHVPFPQAVPQAAYITPEACRLFQGKPCEACLKVCPSAAINVHQAPEEWLLAAGAVILAPGVRPAEVRDFPGYGLADVVTSLEFERLLSATGPGAGKLRRRSDQTEPRTLAFIQCVASRDPRAGSPYCSSLCCLSSLKEALVAQEISSAGLQSTIFYLDLRAQAKGGEDFLARAQERGVRLIRSRVTQVGPGPGGGVQVRYVDAQGRPQELPFDMAVLAVGLRAPGHLPGWARRLGVPLNEHGFIDTRPLAPVLTEREGVLVCGTGREPMDIAEAVTTAGAAAAVAARLLTIRVRSLPAPVAGPEPEPLPEQPVRIGVFLCHCGTNIAKGIDLEKLGASVRKLPGVAHVEELLFACSMDATQRLRETIRELGLNRVVVAACTPRTHEVVFREVVAAAGLNPGYLALANIREQCSWVHQADKSGALKAAQAIVAMAVRQAAVLTPIRPQHFPVIPKALVLGGGVAGMSAAVTLADQGFQTYVVEREPQLGGLARKLYFTLEGLDPQEFLGQLQAEVYRHPNIEVLTRAEHVKSEGHVGQYRTTVRHQALTGSGERLLEHGVILVATGGQAFSPRGRYLYGEDARLLTQLELEEKIHLGNGQLDKARQVVMLQCVGSREPQHPYCSRVCCSEAIKNALLLKERYPRMDILVLYRDIRAYGFREVYYQQAKEKGVQFLPFAGEQPPRLEAPRRGPLLVWVWDELLQQEVGLAADLVILSVGVEPAPGSHELANRLGVPQTLTGFFLEAHQKLRPVDTVDDGIFLCGLAHYPKSLGETVVQAQAAAMRALGILSQTQLSTGEVYAAITPGECHRCLACLKMCPFGAVRLAKTGQPEIQIEMCRGCGICAAECQALAIKMSRFTELEIDAQIEAALV
jgi:heterodisulfide reductase subunit A